MGKGKIEFWAFCDAKKRKQMNLQPVPYRSSRSYSKHSTTITLKSFRHYCSSEANCKVLVSHKQHKHIQNLTITVCNGTYQTLDATMLAHCAPGTSEFCHIGNGLCCQTLKVLVLVPQNLHHRLEPAQICNCSPDLCVTRNFFQNFQGSNL